MTTYFVRRRCGWFELPKDVGDWLCECDVIALICQTGEPKIQTGAAKFEEPTLKIAHETFSYEICFRDDNSIKSKQIWFPTNESGMVVMTKDGMKPRFQGFWQPPSLAAGMIDLTDDA